MNMGIKEELARLLCEARSRAADAGAFGDVTYAQQLEMEADYLIENGVTVQRWIPVTERLPELIPRNDGEAGEAVPVVHGEWIDGRPYVNSRWKVCSVCHQTAPEPHGGYQYCPNCGAKMER